MFLMLLTLTSVYVSLGLLFATIKILEISHKKKKRRSPFTTNFLRGPGQSLLEMLDDINEKLTVYLTSLFVMPIFLYSLYISNQYAQQRPLSLESGLFFAVPGIIITGFLIYKMIRLLNLRRTTRFGYDGEVATGQELNQMMLHGNHVFHDFVAEKFNIDHIVVGPAGVFAVETKARSKPTSKNRKNDAKVIYDGKCIYFPDRRETEPLEQAKAQAAWLQRWLSSCTGEETVVRPVVALPGWFITRTGPGGIPVINPKQFVNIAKPPGGQGLDQARIKRIVHQIDQRCRNLTSRAAEGLGGNNYKPMELKKIPFGDQKQLGNR